MISMRLLSVIFQFAPILIAMVGMLALSSIALYNNDYESPLPVSLLSLSFCCMLFAFIMATMDVDDDDDDTTRRLRERRRRRLKRL